jgi:hypothetical protein
MSDTQLVTTYSPNKNSQIDSALGLYYIEILTGKPTNFRIKHLHFIISLYHFILYIAVIRFPDLFRCELFFDFKLY